MLAHLPPSCHYFGAQYGEGALRVRGKTVGYYNTAVASYGLQAGVQAFGYALFFMTDSARSSSIGGGSWPGSDSGSKISRMNK